MFLQWFPFTPSWGASTTARIQRWWRDVACPVHLFCCVPVMPCEGVGALHGCHRMIFWQPLVTGAAVFQGVSLAFGGPLCTWEKTSCMCPRILYDSHLSCMFWVHEWHSNVVTAFWCSTCSSMPYWGIVKRLRWMKHAVVQIKVDIRTTICAGSFVKEPEPVHNNKS